MITDITSFQKAYSIFLGKAWSTASNMAMTKADPVDALNDAGFSIQTGANVNVTGIDGYGSLQDQYNLYLVGEKTGNYTISLPASPPSTAHITHAETGLAEDVSVCCCCCPCCCCT